MDIEPERFFTQVAPYPHALAGLVEDLHYRPGWRFALTETDRGQGSEGLTLDIITSGYDAYHPGRGDGYRVRHSMPVPPAAYDTRSWRRWLLEQCLLVERHEACEFFAIGGQRPFAPSHGPGNDPYLIREPDGTDLDRRTAWTGDVHDH